MKGRLKRDSILICADSFKDALSAADVCASIAKGLRLIAPNAHIIEFPLSDGGEGFDNIIDLHLDLESVAVEAVDPLGRPIETALRYDAAQRTAYFAMSQVAGLELLSSTERNPLHTSTHGVGMLISEAVRIGATKVYVGLGGSATHDMGTGMAQALGWQFLDSGGSVLKMTGSSLQLVQEIHPPALPAYPHTSIIFVTDVQNPLLGDNGAAVTFAAQKGAPDHVVEDLENTTYHLNEIVRNQLHLDVAELPGAGAAGGLGAGGVVFLGAQLASGIKTVFEVTGFDEVIKHARVVISGEGKLDYQTAHGKLVVGVAQKCLEHNIPLVVFCGQLVATLPDLHKIGITQAIEISKTSPDIESAIRNTAHLLEEFAAQHGEEILNLGR